MLVAFGDIYREVEKLVESQQTSRAKINEDMINGLIKSAQGHDTKNNPPRILDKNKPFSCARYSE
jgi:hypothetical protein